MVLSPKESGTSISPVSASQLSGDVECATTKPASNLRSYVVQRYPKIKFAIWAFQLQADLENARSKKIFKSSFRIKFLPFHVELFKLLKIWLPGLGVILAN